jgi:hypothetical protein
MVKIQNLKKAPAKKINVDTNDWVVVDGYESDKSKIDIGKKAGILSVLGGEYYKCLRHEAVVMDLNILMDFSLSPQESPCAS